MPLTAFAAIIGAKQRLGRVNQTSRREPIFNAPGVVVGLLAVLVAVHVAREWVLPQFYGEDLVDRWTVALAFGVNLAAAPEGIDQPTISLRAILPPDAPAPDPLEFLARLRPKLEAWAERLDRDGFEPLRHAWLQRAHGLGQAARVVQGEHTLEGRIAGLSPRGELELETDEGRRLIAAGDVFLASGA